jgi:hypothetical protein
MFSFTLLSLCEEGSYVELPTIAETICRLGRRLLALGYAAAPHNFLL